MAGTNQEASLTVKLTAQDAGVLSALQQLEAQLNALKSQVGGAGQSADAAFAQTAAGARTMTDAIIDTSMAYGRIAQAANAAAAEATGVSAASAAEQAAHAQWLVEQQVLWAKQGANQISAVTKEMTARDLAVKLAGFNWEVEMGRMALQEQVSQLEQLLAATTDNEAQRIAIERQFVAARKALLTQDIAATREAAAAGLISVDQQKAALTSIATEQTYSLSERALGEKELTRIVSEEEAKRVASAKAAANERLAVAKQENAEEVGLVSSGTGARIGYGVGSIAGMGVGYTLQTLLTEGPKMLAMMGAIGGAFIALQNTESFFKDAVTDASQLEEEMRRLQTAVQNNGQAWGGAKQQIESFVHSEGELTGFSYDKLTKSLNDAVEAGHSTADAFQIIAVAEDVAKAKGMDVAAVTSKIIEAETGEGEALAHLDPRLRDLIKSHADLSTVLTKLDNDMRGQALGAVDDYATGVGRLNNAWTDFKEDVGGWLLPWLADAVHGMENLVDQIHAVVSALHTMQAMTAPGKSDDDIDNAYYDGAITGQQAHVMKKRNADQRADAMHDLLHPDEAAHKKENQERYLAEQRHKHLQRNGIHLQRNPHLGDARSSNGSGYSASYSDVDFSTDATPLDKASTALNKEFEQQRLALGYVSEAMKLATSAQGEYSARVMEAQVVVAQANVGIADTTKLRDAEGTELQKLTAELPKAKQRLEELVKQQHSAADAVNGSKKSNEAAKTSYQNATAKVTDAENAYNRLESRVKSLTASYAQHGQKIAELTLQQQRLNEMIAAGKRAIQDWNDKEGDRIADTVVGTLPYAQQIKAWEKVRDDARVAMREADSAGLPYQEHDKERYKTAQGAIDSLQTDRDFVTPRKISEEWAKFFAKQRELYGEDLALWDATNAQKVAYYREALAKLGAWGSDGTFKPVLDKTLDPEAQRAQLQQIEQMYQQYTASIKGALKDEEAARKKSLETIEGLESGFLDDVLAKHLSFKDSLKHLWADMVSDWAKALEQMVLRSTILAPLNQTMANLFSGAGAIVGGSGVAGAMPSIAGAATSIVGAVAAAPGPGVPTGTAADPTHTVVVNSGAGFNYAMTGSTNGVPGLPSGGGFGALTSIGGAGGFAGIGAFLTGAGSAIMLGGSASSLLGIGSGKAGGAVDAIGSILAAGVLQGAATGTGLLGGLGSFAAAGPLGLGALAAIGVGGYVLGGGIGPHWGPASNYPDRGPDSGTYGQFEANWQGTNGNIANGVSYNAEQQYNVAQGGTPLWKLEEMWANTATATTDAQKALQQQILALEKGNPNADLGVASLHNGEWTLADGAEISYTDAQALEKAYNQNVGSGGLQSSSVFTLSRSMPDFDIGQLSPNGTYVQKPITVTPPSGGSIVDPGETVGDRGGVPRSAVPVYISVNVAGSVVGGSPQEIAVALTPHVATALRDRDLGYLPGSPRANGSRLRSRV